jgi:hypothetical protein
VGVPIFEVVVIVVVDAAIACSGIVVGVVDGVVVIVVVDAAIACSGI